MEINLIISDESVVSMSIMHPVTSSKLRSVYSIHPTMRPTVLHCVTLHVDPNGVGHVYLTANTALRPPKIELNTIPMVPDVRSEPCSCCAGSRQILDKRGADQPCPACDATGAREVEIVSAAASEVQA